MKKRVLSIILMAAMIFSQISYGNLHNVAVVRAEDNLEGECGIGVNYRLTPNIRDTYTLHIEGNGNIKDFSSEEERPWDKYKISKIEMSDGITGIGDYSFSSLAASEIKFSSSLKIIGSHAFSQGLNVDTLTIPEGVKSIEREAFSNTGGEEGSKVAGVAGEDKGKIVSVILPSTLTSLGVYAFSGCAKLVNVTVLGKTDIQSSAFSGCKSLQNVSLAEGSYIDRNSNYVFSGCHSLEKITLPDSMSIDFSKGIFNQCKSLNSINVNGTHPDYISKNGILYNKNLKKLIYYPAGKSDIEYKTENGVTEIGGYAFKDNMYLKRLSFANSLTNLEAKSLYSSTIDSIILPDSITKLTSDLFDEKKLCIYIPPTVQEIAVDVINSNGISDLGIYGQKGSTAQKLASDMWVTLREVQYVTFIPNGGSVAQTQKMIFDKCVYGKLPQAERDGYTFDGWYTFNGKRVTESDIYQEESGGVLYAHWIQGNKAENKSELQAELNKVKISVKNTYTSSNEIQKAAVLISWKKNYNVTMRRIYRSTNKKKGYKLIAGNIGTENTSYTDKKVTKGVKYYYKMRAYGIYNNKKVSGKYSSVKSLKVSTKVIKPILKYTQSGNSLQITLDKAEGSGLQMQYRYLDQKKWSDYSAISGKIKKIVTLKVNPDMKKIGFKIRMRTYVKGKKGKKLYSKWSAEKKIN